MSLSQTKKAINERKRRLDDREKRRRNVFVHDYVRTKYTEIYGECNMFYQSLLEKYPGKLDLTKAKEYKKWRGQLTNNTESIQPIHPESDMTESDTTESIQPIHPESVQPIHPESDTTESDMTESVQPIHPESDTTKSIQPIHPESDTTESVQPIHPESDTTESIQLIHPESDTTESVQPIHPESDTSEAGPSILEVASQGLIPDVSLDIENMDRIVNEIIAELEQDEQIRNLLPYIQSDVEEDEGIELNIETELESIVEPFDYELDEGVEW